MINSDTKLISLFGKPVKNSFSPIIHNYLFEKYKLNNVYTCFEIDDIEKGIEAIKNLKLLGANITIPYKVDVIKYLDYIENDAKFIGAVNTIKNEDGFLKGYNTDGEGFVKSILDKNNSLNNKNILVIGAGGASKSICISLCKYQIKSIKIFNRTLEKAEEIQKIIDKNFDVETFIYNQQIKEKDLEDIDIIINTTSIGMESDECPIDKNIQIKNRVNNIENFKKEHRNTLDIKEANNKIKDILVCDIVYCSVATSKNTRDFKQSTEGDWCRNFSHEMNCS